MKTTETSFGVRAGKGVLFQKRFSRGFNLKLRQLTIPIKEVSSNLTLYGEKRVLIAS